MNESTILLVAMETCIVRLPILYFRFNQFHLQYFDFCIQHPAFFRETYYFINTIINSQPTTEWLKLPNHFNQCISRYSTLILFIDRHHHRIVYFHQYIQLNNLMSSEDSFIARPERSPNPHLCRICNTVSGATTNPLLALKTNLTDSCGDGNPSHLAISESLASLARFGAL